MSNESTEPKARSKPEKPYEGFPLFSHAGSGQWAKKIRGRVVYFGSWRNDREGTAALERFNHEWPHLKEGRTPPPIDVSNGCTLQQLCNAFMRAKENKLNADELSPRTFRDYYEVCKRVLSYFGNDRRVDDLRPDDFEGYRAALAKRLGVTSLKDQVNRTRVLLKFAHDQRLVEQPASYGQSFNRPSAKALRRNRNAAGPKLFERDEVLRILDAADVQLRAMVLLAINGGLGNSDVGNLRESHVDFANGWLDYPRVKTEIPRHVPLWTETRDALRAAIAVRPALADDAAKGLCFVTRQGRPWVRMKAKDDDGPQSAVSIDAVAGQFGKLLRKLQINGRAGLGFYTLRHCFETYGGESRDQVAVDAIMGHVDPSMAANYRHRISDERLRVVVETVRTWLFGPATSEQTEGGAK